MSADKLIARRLSDTTCAHVSANASRYLCSWSGALFHCRLDDDILLEVFLAIAIEVRFHSTEHDTENVVGRTVA